MPVPPTAFAAACKNKRLAVAHVLQNPAGLGIPDQRTERNTENQVLPAFSVHFVAFSVFAVLRHKFVTEPQIRQCIEVGIHLNDHVAALAAVPAVRSACRNIFFPMERHGTISAIAGFDINFCGINKHKFLPF